MKKSYVIAICLILTGLLTGAAFYAYTTTKEKNKERIEVEKSQRLMFEIDSITREHKNSIRYGKN